MEGEGALFLPARAGDDVVDPPGGPLSLPTEAGPVRIMRWQGGVAFAEGSEPGQAFGGRDLRFQPLRQALSLLDDEGARLVGHARQLLQWRLDHRYCGRCGQQTFMSERGSSLVCTGCRREHFPRVTPAVIVLVHDGGRVLLGRAPRFPPGMYSTLAGFVEPGESAEECVHREVMEESGVRVTDLDYCGSQSWPFPHSLMLGYHARYAGGEIRCDDDELEDVSWFPVADLPRLPTHRSIARHLIETYVATRSLDD